MQNEKKQQRCCLKYFESFEKFISILGKRALIYQLSFVLPHYQDNVSDSIITVCRLEVGIFFFFFVSKCMAQ